MDFSLSLEQEQTLFYVRNLPSWDTRDFTIIIIIIIIILFLFCFFFHEHSQITGLQGKGEVIFLIPDYHFHHLQRHLDIIRVITAESSPLHIASSRTWTGSFWFPSASR